VIRNAPMVARNIYRPIDPIGLNIPPAGLCRRGIRDGMSGPAADLPRRQCFHAFTKWPRQGKAIEHAH
jgi:hypothetical protein